MYDSDPVPGDPYEVAQLGKELRGMADEIDKQARNIKALASVEGWDSDAGRAFHEIAGDTSSRLKDAYDRYDEAATAMGTKVREGDEESSEYASELHRAQRLADEGLEEFRAAEADHKAALKVLDPLHGTVPSDAKDSVERTKEGKKRDDAALLMSKARSKIEQAKNIRDDAASRAAKKIKNVIHHDGVRDPGGLMNWLADHADAFSAAATILACVALAAAIVFSGGLAAPFIAALAAAASATALTGRLYDLFARGGKLDLLKIGLDVVGLFPGLGALRVLAVGSKAGRLAGAQAALWEGFTNGFGVKRINDVTRLASRFLSKRKIPGLQLPENGFKPEVVTRYVKGASLGLLGLKGINRLVEAEENKRGGEATVPSVGPRPTPAPDAKPTPSSPGTPSPSPRPYPSSAPFRAALAPTG
ncbi:putative T7SS-secreted protein [Streptomyces sp. CoH17]|uniref:putative T7SS-secreted protein n=1 Tax=Streptomyces sp. CoH17 TaxID=2992806 RepID=UPI00226EFA7B|nr:hypothetical protein [Streptomyces sp. CoH17]